MNIKDYLIMPDDDVEDIDGMGTLQGMLIIRQNDRHSAGKMLDDLPDGLTDLKPYNIINYKSPKEVLDEEALDALISYYINYRQKASYEDEQLRSNGLLLPKEDFRLYALSTYYPHALVKTRELTKVQAGIYTVTMQEQIIRVIVLQEMPKTPNNAIWQLFSADQQGVEYGAAHYQFNSQNESELLGMIYNQYAVDGILPMTDPMTAFLEETKQAMVTSLTPEQKLALLHEIPVEKRLEDIPPEQILAQISPERLLDSLDPQQLKKVMAIIEALLEKENNR